MFTKIFVALSIVDGSVCTGTFQMVFWVSFEVFFGFALEFSGFFSVLVLVFFAGFVVLFC
jgi:hypothetical protein